MENVKILIVDDELITRQGIFHLLDWQKYGLNIIGDVSNGKEAIQFLNNNKCDIVITDVVMPEMDGIELTKYIHENFPNIRVIILSSYSEFDYVKKTLKNGAVDYILKPTLNANELISTLRKYISISENDNCELKFDLAIKNYIEGTVQKLDYDNSTNTIYKLIVFKTTHALEKNLDTIQLGYEKMIFSTFLIQNRLRVMIVDEKFGLNAWQDRMSIYCENCIFCSDGFIDFSIIKQLFEELSNLFDYEFYLSNKKILKKIDCNFSMNSIDFNYDKVYILRKKYKFIDYINYLKEFTELSLENHANPNELKNILIAEFYKLFSMLEEKIDSSDNINFLKLEVINTIENSINSEKLYKNILQIVDDFKIIVTNKGLINYDDDIYPIISYINENYDKSISLENISQKFGFSYNYLSTFFANHMQENFSEYLNNLRIEKACELLSSNKFNISEIGQMVGYSDHSYFCKVFKKIVGQTPSEYKKRIIR